MDHIEPRMRSTRRNLISDHYHSVLIKNLVIFLTLSASIFLLHQYFYHRRYSMAMEIPLELSGQSLPSSSNEISITIDGDDDDDDDEHFYGKHGQSSTYNDTRAMMIEEDLDHQSGSSPSLSSSSSSSSSLLHKRIKRGVLGLASMIRCIAGCNPLSYKDYGCYCGFQGEGYPVDPIDRCCYKHDQCYTHSDCNQALVYFVSYKWICRQNGRASCGYVLDGNAKQICAYQLCECDRKFAKCLSRHRCPKSKPSCRTKRNTIWSLGKLFAI